MAGSKFTVQYGEAPCALTSRSLALSRAVWGGRFIRVPGKPQATTHTTSHKPQIAFWRRVSLCSPSKVIIYAVLRTVYSTYSSKSLPIWLIWARLAAHVVVVRYGKITGTVPTSLDRKSVV